MIRTCERCDGSHYEIGRYYRHGVLLGHICIRCLDSLGPREREGVSWRYMEVHL